MFNFMDKLKLNNVKTFQIRNIPAKTWKKFKIKCMEQDTTLNNGLINLITDYSNVKIQHVD